MQYSMISIMIGAAAAIVVPRQACVPLKHSVAPQPIPNTPGSFGNFSFYSDLAKVVVPPLGFEPIFTNAAAAVRSPGYMNYVELDTYDVSACAQKCNATRGCEAFNIYFQRNPSVEPAAACPNPTAYTLVVCGLYSAPVNATEMVNVGQNRGPVDAGGKAFEVVIRGSNVYNRVAELPSSLEKDTVTVYVSARYTETTTVATTATFSDTFVPFLTPGPISAPSIVRDRTTLIISTPLSTSVAASVSMSSSSSTPSSTRTSSAVRMPSLSRFSSVASTSSVTITSSVTSSASASSATSRTTATTSTPSFAMVSRVIETPSIDSRHRSTTLTITSTTTVIEPPSTTMYSEPYIASLHGSTTLTITWTTTVIKPASTTNVFLY